MKVIHIIKRIEAIDSDIKDLRKLEKSLTKNKSFTTPIFITIEKQINILLDERNKLLALKIENPPQNLVDQIEGLTPAETSKTEPQPALLVREKEQVKEQADETRVREPRPKKEKPRAAVKETVEETDEYQDDDDIPMLTQELIDVKINTMKTSKPVPEKKPVKRQVKTADKKSDDAVKLLDLALEKGNLGTKEGEREKKVKFFRENFPVE